MLTIKVTEAQERRLIRELAHIAGGAPRAMSAALNKTATGMKTDTVRTLAKRYTAKQKDIRAAIRIGQKASPAHLVASVIGERKRALSLMDFRVRPRGATRRRPAGGLTVEVLRGKSARIPHGFIVNSRGGTIAAGRKGRARLPIEKFFGPGVASMMDQGRVANPVMELAGARLEKNINMALDAVEKRII